MYYKPVLKVNFTNRDCLSLNPPFLWFVTQYPLGSQTANMHATTIYGCIYPQWLIDCIANPIWKTPAQTGLCDHHKGVTIYPTVCNPKCQFALLPKTHISDVIIVFERGIVLQSPDTINITSSVSLPLPLSLILHSKLNLSRWIIQGFLSSVVFLYCQFWNGKNSTTVWKHSNNKQKNLKRISYLEEAILLLKVFTFLWIKIFTCTLKP